MNKFLAEKVVSSLPSTLTPNTVYFVRVGTGFDAYVSDSTGLISYSLNNPDWARVNIDCAGTWGATIYIQEVRNGNWRIRKIAADGAVTIATVTNNAGKTQSTAWDARTSLAYSVGGA